MILIRLDESEVARWEFQRPVGADHAEEAVAEGGNPTIVATLTIVVALLPMMFVSGLMGPYMSPIPINASLGMAISLAIAFTVTPWLALKLLGKAAHHAPTGGRLERVFAAALGPFVSAPRAAGRRSRRPNSRAAPRSGCSATSSSTRPTRRRAHGPSPRWKRI